MRFPAILRAPLLHFLLGGAVLFTAFALLDRAGPGPGPDVGVGEGEDARVALDAERVDAIRREFESRNGRAATPVELDRLVALELDEELLYREAVARGLAEGDPGVEARLVQKMLFLDDEASLSDAAALLERARALGLDRDDFVIRRLLAEKLRLLASALESSEAPDEAALRRAYAAQRESLRSPTRRSLVHVFLSQDRRGERTQRDAEALHRKLAARETAQIAAIGLGDAFPSGHAVAARSSDELTRQFGDGFAAQVEELPIGAWSQPIPSAYGLHLVRVDAIEPGEVPDFEAVRERIRLELENDRRERKLEALLAELRTRYEVAVVGSREEKE